MSQPPGPSRFARGILVMLVFTLIACSVVGIVVTLAGK